MRTMSIATILGAIVVGSGCANDAGTPAMTPSGPSEVSGAVRVEIAEINGPYSFYPNPTSMHMGQTLTWHNSDALTHRIVFDDRSLDTGTLAPDTVSQPVNLQAGMWDYHCAIHPSMVGSLLVVAGPK
jgi:plastocyanin